MRRGEAKYHTHSERGGEKKRGATEKRKMGKRRRRILEIESCFGRVGERERERREKREMEGGMRGCHQRGEEAAPSPAAPLLSD